MLKPGLYIVGTPIGNLGDITTRAIEILRGVDFILAEDTRHTRILLKNGRDGSPSRPLKEDGRPGGVSLPMETDQVALKYALRLTSGPNLISCHRFNEQSRVGLVLEKIRSGKAVALVTNAGMPAVADPGARIVAACRRAGLYVTVIPGVSSVTAAIALSGLGGDGFVCEGFLPRKPGARRRRLTQLKELELPAVIFESPYRARQLLEELNEIFPEREVFIGRELTKMNEECLWGTAAQLAALFSERAAKTPGRAIKGELTFVIAPPKKAKGENMLACPIL